MQRMEARQQQAAGRWQREARRVAARLDALAGDPRPPGVETLQGTSDLYRVRVGDYRIVYQVEHKALVVLVVRIGHRRKDG